MPYLKFMLDLDASNKEDVEEEAKRITEQNIKLGPYTLEQSEGGNWHILWHRSHLNTFHEGYLIALDSSCDKDWLDICKKYQMFSLFTYDSSAATVKSRQRKYYQTGRGTVKGTSLIITPNNYNELKRLQSISESVQDPTWTFKTENPLIGKPRVVIGCIDQYQAQRRIRFLREKCGLQFQEKII